MPGTSTLLIDYLRPCHCGVYFVVWVECWWMVGSVGLCCVMVLLSSTLLHYSLPLLPFSFRLFSYFDLLFGVQKPMRKSARVENTRPICGAMKTPARGAARKRPRKRAYAAWRGGGKGVLPFQGGLKGASGVCRVWCRAGFATDGYRSDTDDTDMTQIKNPICVIPFSLPHLPKKTS
jgi:hypothetical protein